MAVLVLFLGARWVRSSQEDAEPGTGAEGGIEFETGTATLAGGGGDARDVVVHVAGAVRRPGVYRLPLGARVADAVERAGGPGPGAEQEGINLAARLADGQQVVVPERAPAGSPAGAAEDGPISLGSATVEELDTIEGIGPVTAEAIIAYRDEHGGLGSIDELDEVSGIGPATLDALRARLQP